MKKLTLNISLPRVIIASVLALITAYGLWGSKRYQIAKTIAIEAPADEIHIFVGNLKRWPKWVAIDHFTPTGQFQVIQSSGVGATQRWRTNTGTASMSVIREQTWYGLDYEIIYSDNSPTTGGIHYSLSDDGQMSYITWAEQSSVPVDFFGPFLAIWSKIKATNKAEESLINLKNLLES